VAHVWTALQSFAAGLVVPKTTGTGIKVDTDSPTWGFADLLGNLGVRVTGGVNPVFSAYHGTMYQYSFGTAPGETELILEFHTPHDYVPGTDWYIHVHWSVNGAGTGTVNWMYDLAYAKGYGQEDFTGTAGANDQVVVGVTQDIAATHVHQIAEVQCSASGGLISPAAVNVSITSGTAALTAASALFTAADVGRTVAVLGAGAAAATLNTTVSAFTSTTQVTLADNASTTVTAQPSYRYRVLDSARLEVDGLLLARAWRDSARAADTLSVAPFSHFVDLHYQTNGVMGTKTKNAPFYS
jgi:hypothetical protein